MTAIEVGMVVDVAQNGLRRPPHFEHERGRVAEEDVFVQRGIERRGRVRQTGRSTATDLLRDLFVSKSGDRGPFVEVMSYLDEARHENETYYTVDLGENVAVYPESCLVPAPEYALGGGGGDLVSA